MTVSYPLSFPSLSIKKSSFRLVTVTSESESQFSKVSQSYDWGGDQWQGEVTFPPMKRDDAAELQAFLLELRGKVGTFLYGDPDALALGLRGVGGGIPLVKGAGQTGNSLIIDGLTPATANILKKGDYFQRGTALSSRLHMVTQNVTSNTSGEATLNFYPALSSASVDNEPLVFEGAKGLFKSADGMAQWDSNEASIYGFTFAFKSVVGE